MLRFICAVTIITVFPVALVQAQCTTEWNSAVNGNWTDASRWSGGSVPSAGDHACIRRPGTYTVTLNANTSVGALTVGDASGAQTLVVPSNRTLTVTGPGVVADGAAISVAGTLIAESNFNIAGELDWTSGTIGGSGLITLNGTATATSTSNKTLTGHLHVTGGFEWAQGHLYLATGADLENSGEFVIGAHSNNIYRSGAPPQRFVNDGVVRRAGPGSTSLNAPFENEGTISVETGTVTLTYESRHTNATWTAAPGAVLHFSNGTHVVSGRTTGLPQGQIIHSARMNAEAGAVLAIGGTGLRWHGGILDGGGELVNEALIIAGASSNKTLHGRLRNAGTFEWEAGHLYLATGATLHNAALFDVGAHGSNMYRSGAPPQVLVNDGTFRRDGAGASHLNLPLENNGLVEILQGEIQINYESRHHNGRLAVAEEGRLLFNGGTHTATGTLTGEPAGDIIHSSSLVAGDGGLILNIGGTGFQWTGGNVSGGSEAAVNRGLIRIGGSPNKTLAGLLRNEGTIDWEQGHVYLATGAELENREVINIHSHNSTMYRSGATPQLFSNYGLLRRLAGGQSSIDVPLASHGTIQVDVGTVRISHRSTSYTSRLESSEGASLIFSNGSHEIAGTVTGSPAGVVALAANVLVGRDATLDVGGSGIQWQSATIQGSLPLTNEGRLILTGSSNKTLAAELVNEGKIEWDQGHFFLAQGGRVDNRDVFEVSAGANIYRSGAGSRAFHNRGTFTRLGTGSTTAIDVEFSNVGDVTAAGGTLRFTHLSSHTDVDLAVSSGATLEFRNGTHSLTNTSLSVPAGASVEFGTGARIITGTLASTPRGSVRWTSGLMMAGAAPGEIAVAGEGLVWSGGTVNPGEHELVNSGTMILDGTVARRIQAGTFRNTGAMSWVSGTLSVLQTGVFRNDGSFEIRTDQASIGPEFSPGEIWNAGRFERPSGSRSLTIWPHFENVAGGVLVASEESIHFRSLRNREQATISGDGGTISVSDAAFENEGIIAPGASPGHLSMNRSLRMTESAELHIELAGTQEATQYDQLEVFNMLHLDGVLDVTLLNGFRPSEGSTFRIVRRTPALATKSGTDVTGGFTQRRGLVDVDAGMALYPTIDDDGVLLTAAALTPLASTIELHPAMIDAGGVRLVTITGEGFPPDATVTLECVECETPVEFGTIAGAIGTVSTESMEVWFDLTTGNISGSYELIVEDPREGEVRVPITINEGPLYVSVRALKEATAEGRDPGFFVVRTNRPLKEPLHVPFELFGSAQLYVHYMTDVLGGRVTIPAERDSALVSIFPIAEGAETTRSISLQLQYDQPPLSPGLPHMPLAASMNVRGGDASGEFRVLASSPRSGGNAGTVTLKVGGTGFSPSATVMLTGGPSGSMHPTRVQVNENGTLIEATFLMSGQAPGARNVAVTDGASEHVLPGAFQVEAAVFPHVHVEMIAPERVPRTRVRTYSIVLHNQGNVDVGGYATLTGLPNNTTWNVRWDEITGPGGRKYRWSEIAPVLHRENHMVIDLPSLVLRAGESRRIDIEAAVNDPQLMELVAAWIYY